MKRPLLDIYDKEILRLLYQMNSWTTTNMIAEVLGISWTTVDEHLKALDKIYVRKRQRGNRTYWSLIR